MIVILCNKQKVICMSRLNTKVKVGRYANVKSTTIDRLYIIFRNTLFTFPARCLSFPVQRWHQASMNVGETL